MGVVVTDGLFQRQVTWGAKPRCTTSSSIGWDSPAQQMPLAPSLPVSLGAQGPRARGLLPPHPGPAEDFLATREGPGLQGNLNWGGGHVFPHPWGGTKLRHAVASFQRSPTGLSLGGLQHHSLVNTPGLVPPPLTS